MPPAMLIEALMPLVGSTAAACGIMFSQLTNMPSRSALLVERPPSDSRGLM